MSVIKYGLIGHPLAHSLSPYIHQRILEVIGENGRYDLYELAPEELPATLPKLMKDLAGFNCTIPFKMDVIPYLDALSPEAKDCGAVNTVFQGRGYNTDIEGFRASVPDLLGKKALILGAGGVSHMMAHEARKMGARVYLYARNDKKAHALAERIGPGAEGEPVFVVDNLSLRTASDMDVVLNGTPVGMWPFSGEMPCPESIFRTGQEVFDSIYNPAATKMVLRAKKAGAHATGGLRMLFFQALAAQKIFHPGVSFDEGEMLAILPDLAREMLRRSPSKYLFTGFMGAGKTTTARAVAKTMGVAAYDLDEVIERERGCSVAEIFRRDGEAGFRRAEALCLRDLLKRPEAMMISAGGGAVIQPAVQEILRDNGTLSIYLHASMDVIWTRVRGGQGRPLLGFPEEEESARFRKAAELYSARLPIYTEWCDMKISSEKEPELVVKDVIDALGYGGLKE